MLSRTTRKTSRSFLTATNPLWQYSRQQSPSCLWEWRAMPRSEQHRAHQRHGPNPGRPVSMSCFRPSRQFGPRVPVLQQRRVCCSRDCWEGQAAYAHSSWGPPLPSLTSPRSRAGPRRSLRRCWAALRSCRDRSRREVALPRKGGLAVPAAPERSSGGCSRWCA